MEKIGQLPGKIIITDAPWGNMEIEQNLLGSAGYQVEVLPDSTLETLRAVVPGAVAIGVCWAPLSEEVIQAAEKCQIIARYGIGLDNIDISSATTAGIPVTYIPDYCISEVADHTLALLLSFARKTVFYSNQIREGHYQLQAGSPLRRLSELTLGLAGLGRIGLAVAMRARGLGMRVIAWKRSPRCEVPDVELVDWETLLEKSDFLSLHLPLTAETQHLIGWDALQKMQSSAILINTSRGGLVDQEALWEALCQQKIAGAALDVFETEPPDLSHPLFRDSRVLATPHAAFLSQESLEELRLRVCHQILTRLQGGRPEHVVNPQVLQNP